MTSFNSNSIYSYTKVVVYKYIINTNFINQFKKIYEI